MRDLNFKRAALGFLVLFCAWIVLAQRVCAQESSGIFQANTEDLNAGPVVMETLAGVIGSAGAGMKIQGDPYFRLGVDYPLPIAGTCKDCIVPLRGYTDVGLTTGQAASSDLQSITAFKSWQFSLGLYRIIGAADYGLDPKTGRTTQRITFALCGEFGAKALFDVPATTPITETSFRHGGLGACVAESKSGALLRGFYGHDGEVGPGWGAGDFLIYGQVPLIGKNGPFVLGAGVSLPVKNESVPVVGLSRRAIYRFAATVNINAVVSAFQRPTQ